MLISIFHSHAAHSSDGCLFAVFDLQKSKRDDIKAQMSFSRPAVDEEVLNLHKKPALETTRLGSKTVKRKVRIKRSKLKLKGRVWTVTFLPPLVDNSREQMLLLSWPSILNRCWSSSISFLEDNCCEMGKTQFFFGFFLHHGGL